MVRWLGILVLFGCLGCDGFFASDEEVELNVLPQPSVEEDVVVFEFEEESQDPVAFLFESLTIEKLGSEPATGFIPMLLGAQWDFDVSSHNLNIILMIHSTDEETGASELSVGFGIGDAPGNLCIEPETWTGILDTQAEGRDFALLFDMVSIYSEDPDGTTFNCNPDPQVLNAVPFSKVEGFAEASEDWNTAVGLLRGCLTLEEAESLCSCVGTCQGDAHPSCGGCPNGSAPLSEKLGNIVTTEECTTKTGEAAFDLHASFTANRIPMPEFCE